MKGFIEITVHEKKTWRKYKVHYTQIYIDEWNTVYWNGLLVYQSFKEINKLIEEIG